jgi:hypothetical protein
MGFIVETSDGKLPSFLFSWIYAWFRLSVFPPITLMVPPIAGAFVVEAASSAGFSLPAASFEPALELVSLLI